MVLVYSSITNKLMYKHGQTCKGVRTRRVLIKTYINRQLLGPGSYRGVGSTNIRIGMFAKDYIGFSSDKTFIFQYKLSLVAAMRVVLMTIYSLQTVIL